MRHFRPYGGGLTAPGATETETPTPGAVSFYAVRVSNACGSNAGAGSGG